MTLLRYAYSTLIELSQPVQNHSFSLRCQPMQSYNQRTVWQRTTLIPFTEATQTVDAFGNVVTSGFIAQRHNFFAYEAIGLVDTTIKAETPQYAVNDSVYLYPTQLTTPSPNMIDVAKQVGPLSDARSKIECVMDILMSKMSYQQGTTDVNTTAEQAWAQRMGVCQDFAHISIVMCRLLKLPARYVCGLMLGHGQTHAWVEAFDGSAWIAFDPTNSQWVNADRYIKFAHGRDFADCSISRGTFTGVAQQKMTVSVDVWEE
ncbi:MAG: transglutaminase family protein [Bacteroidales bacterium]|nr:transglutaminase family protein [Bacteroidales bacterium]